MSCKTLYVCIVGLAVSSCGLSTFAMAMEIKRPSLMAAAKLGNIKLFHKDNKFVVERDGKEKNIQSYWVSPILRGANPDHLRTFLNNGYVRLNELKDANGSIDYKLDAYGRLNGGGPILGFFTAVGGTVATGVAATGVFIALVPTNPAAAIFAGAAVAKGGMALTVAATVAATAAPTP